MKEQIQKRIEELFAYQQHLMIELHQTNGALEEMKRLISTLEETKCSQDSKSEQ